MSQNSGAVAVVICYGNYKRHVDSATQGHVARAFGVPLVAIKRATKLYRERGPADFFVPGARREGSKLNAEKLEQARALLVQGHPLPVVSAQTGVLSDTLRKAIKAGRLPPVRKNGSASAGSAEVQGNRLEGTASAAESSDEVRVPGGGAQAVVELQRDKESPGEPSTLSERSLADSQAEMGYGTTRPLERVMASCGLLTSAELEFVAADDVTGRFRLEELGANLPRQLALKFRIEEGSVRIYVTSLRPDSNARFDRAVLAGLIHPCPICHGKGIHSLKRTAHLERYSIYVAGDKYGKCARYVKEALRRAVGFWQRCGGRFSRPVIGTEFLAFVFPDVF